MSFIQAIQNSIERKMKRYKTKLLKDELKRIKELPRYTEGYTSILGKSFKFHDNLSFVDTYEELFVQEIYRFTPGIERDGVILDCGANMGLSIIFFALNYPNHRIIAYEPDKYLFEIIKENIKNFKFQNVDLINKAVWIEETELDFYTDGGMGGRVINQYEAQKPVKVQTVSLPDVLCLQNSVDFLKLDIEGAETRVLKACSPQLQKVNFLFFEYHNMIGERQVLHELLQVVADASFTYYVKESAVRGKPFVENPVICETFDMALNVFCFKSGGR